LLAAGGPLPKDLACETLGWNGEQFMACRNWLGSYVIENVNGYELFHKTLAEWLGDQSSGSFYIDKLIGQQVLADTLLRELEPSEGEHSLSKKKAYLARWKDKISCYLLDWLPSLSQGKNPSALHNVGLFNYFIGNYKSAELMLKQAILILENAHIHQEAELAKYLNDLGVVSACLGDSESEEKLYKRAFKIREKTLGLDHLDTAESLHNIASIYFDKENYKDALLY
jgi:tetratricopeptide (TPR) repeat protein